MICSQQCYILKQVNDEPCLVSQRIAYKYLRNIQPAKFSTATPRGIIPLGKSVKKNLIYLTK